MPTLIEPRTLKGFRDYLPAAMITRERLIETAKAVYRRYGFVPIDTPALELAEILLGKGGAESDKQMFRFQDGGGRDVAMRFDLTVPLARFVAQHHADLGTPFKRYHVGPVWRGENTQRGRYREFVQCDFDTVGTRSLAADVETLLVASDLFAELRLPVTLHVNNRKILSGLLEKLGLAERAVAVLRAVDKLAKVGPDAVVAEIVAAGATEDQARDVLRLVSATGTNAEILATLDALVTGSSVGESGARELREILESCAVAGVPDGRLVVDVSIARGLDYYTGTVFETLLDDLPAIGSVCSGGRYDDLAGLYTKADLPGIGGSLGLDRLLAALEELGRLPARTTTADVLVTWFEPGAYPHYLGIATRLRAAGIATELYPEPTTKKKGIGHQLAYANSHGHRVALVAGRTELAAATVQVKDLATGAAEVVPVGDALDTVRRFLG